MKLLVVEDDTKLAGHLISNLKEQGIFADHVSSEAELTGLMSEIKNVDVIILDRLLGLFDTKTILPTLKSQHPNIPILVLSAVNTPNERTEVINLGADDYMGKPFSTQELVARVRAFSRRSQTQATHYIKIGNLVIDTFNRTVSVGGDNLTLPAKEFALLRTLAMQPGRVWSKPELLDYIWGQSNQLETNVVEATIANVRRKVQGLGSDVSIRNMRNTGYWVEE